MRRFERVTKGQGTGSREARALVLLIHRSCQFDRAKGRDQNPYHLFVQEPALPADVCAHLRSGLWKLGWRTIFTFHVDGQTQIIVSRHWPPVTVVNMIRCRDWIEPDWLD